MKTLLLRNANRILSNENSAKSSILVINENIGELAEDEKTFEFDERIELTGATVYAGFVDFHIHGAVGVDVNAANADDLRRMAKFLAAQGVTGWLPTFVPDADENYLKVISAIDEVMRTQDLAESEPAARILGVHYEGVFANEKMCGALRPKYFKQFKKGNEIDELPKLKNGVHLTTLAPEIENGIELIKKLTGENWIVAVGHTNAKPEVLDRAFDAGARHLTHFFNAMTAIHHREIGVAGWALSNENATFDIIADGVHVAPPMLKFAARAKTPDKVSLISDSILPAGLGDGEYRVWDENIAVKNGKTENERGSIAGSVITMLDAVKMMRSLGFSEREVSQMASLNPAKLLGIAQNYGSIEPGKRADLVALDAAGNVELTVIGGRIAFQKTN